MSPERALAFVALASLAACAGEAGVAVFVPHIHGHWNYTVHPIT